MSIFCKTLVVALLLCLFVFEAESPSRDHKSSRDHHKSSRHSSKDKPKKLSRAEKLEEVKRKNNIPSHWKALTVFDGQNNYSRTIFVSPRKVEEVKNNYNWYARGLRGPTRAADGVDGIYEAEATDLQSASEGGDLISFNEK